MVARPPTSTSTSRVTRTSACTSASTRPPSRSPTGGAPIVASAADARPSDRRRARSTTWKRCSTTRSTAAKVRRRTDPARDDRGARLVDRDTGVCVLAPNLRWTDVPVVELFGDALEVAGDGVEHAARVGVRREPARRGPRRRTRSCGSTWVPASAAPSCRTASSSPGHAGSPARSGTAASSTTGLQCHCGKYGCLEVYTSAEAIAAPRPRRRRALAHQDTAPRRRRARRARRARGRARGARRRRPHARPRRVVPRRHPQPGAGGGRR